MKNVGSIDRIIRFVLGFGLIISGAYLQLTNGQFWWLAIPGAVFVTTAAVSTCPLYLPFGLSTLRRKS